VEELFLSHTSSCEFKPFPTSIQHSNLNLFNLRLFLQGLPIFYLELAIGQRLRKGAIGLWAEVSPYLGGIGISSAIVSFIVALYYNTIIAWCLIYFLHSFENPLPWAECPKVFNTNNMTYYLEKECVVRLTKLSA
jgi:solute carrier family 6 (neurotransmitter transporter, amino acid/orphan) member 15/16/17/18/20